MKTNTSKTFRLLMVVIALFLTTSFSSTAMACGCKHVKAANYQVYRVQTGCSAAPYYAYRTYYSSCCNSGYYYNRCGAAYRVARPCCY